MSKVKIKFTPKTAMIGLMLLVLVAGGGFVLLSKSQVDGQPSQQILGSQDLSDNQSQPRPVLEIFSGEVEVKSVGQSEFSKGQNGQTLEVGDIIKTGSDGRAQILYPSHSVTRIDFNSQMTLEQFNQSPSQTKVRVGIGRIWSRVAKLFGKDDFSETQTDTLVASVRGTSYGLGILADGSNKISVSRSQVHIDCNANSYEADVMVNKKVTTKCSDTLSVLNWGGDEANDEWFNWNLDQDKLLDSKYGLDSYEDLPNNTPTPKPTVKPTAKPTIKPTASPTPTPTASPNNTPTPLTISKVEVICSPYLGNPCSSRADTQLKLTGNGYSAGAKPTVTLSPKNPYGTQQGDINADEVTVNSGGDGTLIARFTSYIYGDYKVILHQYDQTAEGSVSIVYLQ